MSGMLVLNEDLKISEKADAFYKKHTKHMNALQDSPVGKARSIQEWDLYCLGRMFEQWDRTVQMHEAAGNMSQLGALPKLAYDLIGTMYGVSPVNVICSNQPIPDQTGMVYWLESKAKTSRGNVTAGQKLINPLAVPDVYPEDFSTDSFRTVNFVTAANGDQSYNDVDLKGGDELMVPLDPRRVTIWGSAIFNSGADVATFPTMEVQTDGTFGVTVKVNGTLYSVYGVVDFATGLVDVEFSANPSGQTDLYIDFATLAEAATNVPQVELNITEKLVRARMFAIKATWGLFQKFIMANRFGGNVEDQLMKDALSAMNNEVMAKVMRYLRSNVPGGNTTTWYREPQTGVALGHHKETFHDSVIDAESKLLLSAGRGFITFMVAGRRAAAALASMEKFTLLYNDTKLGPHIYGMYDGKVVVRIPDETMLDTDTVICGFKGDSPWEAPVVFSSFMPLTTTPEMIEGTNNLQSGKALAMGAAIELMVPNFLTKLVINQTGFGYGGNQPT